MVKTKIELLLTQAFNPSFLEVIDESHKHIGHAGAKQGGHYQIIIASAVFEGKKLLESHRLIYQTIEPVKSSIHALAIKIIKNSGH